MKRITTLAQLAKAVEEKRSVVGKHGMFERKGHLPAAWVMNLSGAFLHDLMYRGLFIYTKSTSK